MFRLKLKHKRAWHRHDREIEWQSREARNRACSDLCKFFISITETAKKNNKQLLDKVFKISRIIVLLYTEQKKWKSCFCFYTDGKQHKVCELDMITLRNHAPQSYMT